MKLVRIESHRGHRMGILSINVQKAGTFIFSKSLAITLDLKKGNAISFYQDEDSKSDWYIKLEKEGLPIRGINGSLNGSSPICSSASVANDLLKSIGKNKKATMIVSSEPIEGGYYPIITKSAKGE